MANNVQFPTLKSMFPEYVINGAIFSKMQDAPWINAGTALEMDIAYLGSLSGIKMPAMLPFDFVTDGVLDQQRLADVLWKLFGENWKRLWDGYMSEYDPLQNYKIADKTVRSETIERDIQRDGTLDYTGDGTSTTTNDLTSKVDETDVTTVNYGQEIDSEQTANNYTHAFNTLSAVPTGVVNTTGHEKHSGADTTNNTIDGTTKNTGTVGVVSHDKGDTKTSTKTNDDVKDNETIDRDRSGNMGQNTFQDLLRQEFELWKWNFYLQVFEDCDRFLVLPYYGSFCSQIMSRFNTVN